MRNGLFLFLLISFMFSTEKHFASEVSQITYQPLEFSSISISASSQYSENQFTNNICSVWWPSPNLFISAGMSPNKSDDDINLYYHSSLGYTPLWTLSDKFSTTVSIGMHRFRFSDEGDFRWYHFAILESVNFFEIDWNLNWIYLFDTDWEHHQLQVETAKTIKELYQVHFGFTTQLLDKIKFTPSIKISLAL
ncbi:MAG: hypothetical protein ISR90_04975 [Candidatus Marinimicrobia bacterium]|nr:hypothetical protein [Candidatus Neomarinimicrobiota bacterium]MBL7023388.1 hypothetical protein [Candidatus Neomarinimicrobiota bacterium]MBL7109731.1 hypothetical protein [Candidatus Neomarinimicrobiota bacterium]